MTSRLIIALALLLSACGSSSSGDEGEPMDGSDESSGSEDSTSGAGEGDEGLPANEVADYCALPGCPEVFAEIVDACSSHLNAVNDRLAQCHMESPDLQQWCWDNYATSIKNDLVALAECYESQTFDPAALCPNSSEGSACFERVEIWFPGFASAMASCTRRLNDMIIGSLDLPDLAPLSHPDDCSDGSPNDYASQCETYAESTAAFCE